VRDPVMDSHKGLFVRVQYYGVYYDLCSRIQVIGLQNGFYITDV
jgi:hypothetical protein